MKQERLESITCVEQCETLSEFWYFTQLANRQKPRSVSLQEMYKYGELCVKEKQQNLNEANAVLISVVDSQKKTEPCVIQSAFNFNNGKKIIIYTGALGIISYECDENWKLYSKPFATCPKEMMTENPTDYHKSIRDMHGEQRFVKEYSTEIDW